MARIAVVNDQTLVVENIIIAEMSDGVFDDTFFIDASDKVVKIGDVYNRTTNEFELSAEEQDRLQKEYAAQYASLVEKAWEE